MIPQNIIDEIINKVSIVDVIGRFTEIKKSGRNSLALCPFHKEKTPSFSISEEKGLYHCFGCGASGGTIKFLMEYQKLTFVEAVQDLAKMAGIDLQQYMQAGSDYSSRDRDLMLSVNREAMQYFHQNLLAGKDSAAAAARGYLKQRKLSLETVKTYRLGFGGASWNGLLAFLKEKGFQEEDAVKTGLAISGNRGLYDRFKDRVIFPIMDREGNPVGFGGRILTDSKETAKYVNTSENQLFRKGSLLFSLHFAKDEIVKEKRAFLVEGYMDVIALHQNGIKNAVAPLGTSFTEQQLAVLKRYTETVFFIFDGDEAGITAANRALDLAAGSDLQQWTVILPQKKDPYDVVMEEGKDAFLNYAEQKKLSPVDFKIRYFAKRIDASKQKVKFLASIFPYLAKLSVMKREHGFKAIAAFLREDYGIVQQEYNDYFIGSRKYFGRTLKISEETLRMEKLFIGLLIMFPGQAKEASAIVDGRMLENAEIKALLDYILKNPGKTTKDISNTVQNPEILDMVAEYAQREDLKESLLMEIAFKLKLAYIKKEMAKNAELIRQNEEKADPEQVRKLMKEKLDLVAAAAETEKTFKTYEEYE